MNKKSQPDSIFPEKLNDTTIVDALLHDALIIGEVYIVFWLLEYPKQLTATALHPVCQFNELPLPIFVDTQLGSIPGVQLYGSWECRQTLIKIVKTVNVKFFMSLNYFGHIYT